jgi:phage host-nuclease inhibitor protein Gam
MTSKPTRLKAPTLAAVPQSKNDCAADIKTIGDLQRQHTREQAVMNDAIAAITLRHQPKLDAIAQAITQKQTGVQAWCEAHRTELCGENDRLGKTANLVTGDVSWRQRPPKVNLRDVDSVLETLARMGLHRFIRNKQEPNKDAMLNEPEAVRGIAGITVVTGVEDFLITPFEVPAEAA